MANVKISFKLNGKRVSAEAPVQTNLLKLLREHLEITSPKFGCEQGNCGACTVWLDGEPVNSCMVLAATVDGREVTTLEGLGTLERPHPLQEAITEHYGAQCGYCTPGMIMSAAALLKRNPSPTRDDVVEAIVGNVCRCTGYSKIVESVLAAAHNGHGR
jgi:carbon-monoxide dehydrogenase small subunit